MSVLGDPTIVHCRDEPPPNIPQRLPCTLRKAISIPAVSSLVRDSWNWAGDTLHTYRDGLSAEQRKQRADIEDRKQVLYLKIKNVSGLVPGRRRVCRVTLLTRTRAAGCVVRGMAELRRRVGRVGTQ
jgi:hypothetical protein